MSSPGLSIEEVYAYRIRLLVAIIFICCCRPYTVNTVDFTGAVIEERELAHRPLIRPVFISSGNKRANLMHGMITLVGSIDIGCLHRHSVGSSGKQIYLAIVVPIKPRAVNANIVTVNRNVKATVRTTFVISNLPITRLTVDLAGVILVKRKRWVVDKNIPVFTQGRAFVERWL